MLALPATEMGGIHRIHTEPGRSPNQQVYLCATLMTHSAVGFSWMRSFMYVSPSRHLSSGKADYFTQHLLRRINAENCKAGLTDVASDLIKGQIFWFHDQRPGKTGSEVSDSKRKCEWDKRVCYLSWLRKRVNTSQACRSSVSSTAMETLRNCGAWMRMNPCELSWWRDRHKQRVRQSHCKRLTGKTRGPSKQHRLHVARMWTWTTSCSFV